LYSIFNSYPTHDRDIINSLAWVTKIIRIVKQIVTLYGLPYVLSCLFAPQVHLFG